MDIKENISDSYKQNFSEKSYANTYPKQIDIFGNLPPEKKIQAPAETNFSQIDFLQRKNVINAIRRKKHSGKYSLSSELLFNDLKLSKQRLANIEKLIIKADKKEVISKEFSKSVFNAIYEYKELKPFENTKDAIKWIKEQNIKTKNEKIQEDYNWNCKTGKKTKNELRYKIRNKIISMEIALNLALSNPQSEIRNSYLNTIYYCQSMFTQDGYKITSKYCNNRHCYSCNRIRTGKLMNNYMPFIDYIKEDMYLVTLTIKNVEKQKLKSSIREMYKNFTLIKDQMRKQGNILTGLRKLEVTHNHKTNEFHPHFHILVSGYMEAIELYRQWFEYNPGISFKGQDIEEANINSGKELFKYFTKFWSKTNKESEKIIDYQAQDTIYNAIKGTRIFQTFGLKKFKEETKIEIDESEEIEPKNAGLYNINPEYENYYFNPEIYNFMSPSGTELIDFRLNKKDSKLMTAFNASLIESPIIEEKQQIKNSLVENINKNWWQNYS